VMLTSQAAMTTAAFVRWDARMGEVFYITVIFLVMGVFLVADSYTLCWSALSYSLGSRSSAVALAKSVVWVMFVPVLPVVAIVAAGTPTALVIHGGVLTLWVALSIAVDLFDCARAHANVVENFRGALARTWRPPPNARAAWKALSAIRKGVLRRAGLPAER